MLIQTDTGFENFPNASAKAHIFICPTPRFPGKEMHLGVAAKGGNPDIRKVGAVSSVPAAPGLRREMGQWNTASYQVPNGAVLKIFASRSGGWASMRVMANQFILAREDAALRRISVPLTNGHANAAKSRANFEGRFDLLTLQEALDLGVLVPPSFRGSFDPAMQRRAFEYTVLDEELRSKVTLSTRAIETDDGGSVEVPTASRGRALDL